MLAFIIMMKTLSEICEGLIMGKNNTVEIGSVWERKKGHGWMRRVIDRYSMGGKEWCIYKSKTEGDWEVRYVEMDGVLFDAAISICTVDAMKRWGRKVEDG